VTRHLGSLAEPAVIVGAFADPLQEDRGAPVAGSYLGRRSCNGVLRFVHAGFLRRRRWNLFGSAVLGVLVPHVLRIPKLLRDSELQVRNGGYGVAETMLLQLSVEDKNRDQDFVVVKVNLSEVITLDCFLCVSIPYPISS